MAESKFCPQCHAAHEWCNCSSNPLSTYHPKLEPTGHFTGRCSKCGSSDLWDDPGTLAYGCNKCGAILHTSG